MNKLGERIKKLRLDNGLNQGAVAESLDISTPAYSKIESGITDINISRLEQIAEFFGLSAAELLSDGEFKPANDGKLKVLYHGKKAFVEKMGMYKQLNLDGLPTVYGSAIISVSGNLIVAHLHELTIV